MSINSCEHEIGKKSRGVIAVILLRDTNKIDEMHLEALKVSASRTIEFVYEIQEDHSLIELSEYDHRD